MTFNINSNNTAKPQTVAQGGTGATTLTGVLIGSGTTAITGNAVSQYNTLVGGAANAITSIAPGSSGYVLTSNGASANPSYQAAPASGSLILLSTQIASNGASSLAFTSLITGTYSTYFLRYNSVCPNGDDYLGMQLSTDNGSTYISTGYASGANFTPVGQTGFYNLNSTTRLIISGQSTGASVYPLLNGGIFLSNFQNSGAPVPSVYGQYEHYYPNQASVSFGVCGGAYIGYPLVNAFKLLFSSNTFYGGVFSLYGIQA